MRNIALLQKSQNLKLNNLIRTLANEASKPPATPKSDVEKTLDSMNITPLKVDTSELDKPQWERSNRAVSYLHTGLVQIL